MARIITYPSVTPVVGDYLVGTQKTTSGNQTNPTKNFTVGDVVNAGLGYKVYSALLTQAGTDNPTVDELKNNTTATMTWTRVGVGQYRCTASSNVFTTNKTQVFVNVGTAPNGPGSFVEWNTNTSYVEINTYNISGTSSDDLIDKGSLEIRIYS